MWLLNHAAAREFELPMLKQAGIGEIFLPKTYPNDPGFRSGSVDWSEDEALTIPRDDLDVLNATDWYASPGREAWEIANRHFDLVFFMLHSSDALQAMVRHFRGLALWRVYGLSRGNTYAEVLRVSTRQRGERWLRALGKRFFFAEAYDHLHTIEPEFLRQRRLYLPLGLADAHPPGAWRGEDRRILFVCPDIGFNPYYGAVYKQFKRDFKGLPYVVAGAQPIRVPDPDVLGFLPRAHHERNMRELRLMFYHSSEPYHVHFHPFEAVRIGMPLLFMAGGMLDRLGGEELPGRCRNIEEARRSARRILDGDREFIDAIRATQERLLERLRPQSCVAAWNAGITQVLGSVNRAAMAPSVVTSRRARIAVIVPERYRGGSLRGAKLLAETIESGARQAASDVEVVLAHLEDPMLYPAHEFADLRPSIKRRPYEWRIFNRAEAHRAMAYAGVEGSLDADAYQIPDDGMRQFMDCDLWVLVSDRLLLPLLPIRPYVAMVYDYLQRYEPVIDPEFSRRFLAAGRTAERVLVTTEFTRSDATQYAGVPPTRVIKVPMLAPIFAQASPSVRDLGSYFLWTTNLGPHKNHEAAFRALQLYYEQYDGELACRVTGVNTKELFTSTLPHLRRFQQLVTQATPIKRRITLLGELPDRAYRRQLANSRFLWHAGKVDNGTFSVVEAASLRVPALSSDYPAMREIAAEFSVPLTWMDPSDPDQMGQQLKFMEINADRLRVTLPSATHLATRSVESLGPAYWAALRECL